MVKVIQCRWFACCLSAALTVPFGAGAAGKPTDARHWTLNDIVTIPEVSDVALSGDGRSVAYVLRKANIATDRTEFELHIVPLVGDSDRVVMRSLWIDRLQSIPGNSGWSILADIGAGVQLYTVDARSDPRPLIVNPNTVLVGNADGAEFGYNGTHPVRFGVNYYDWSPDGKRLFYSMLVTQESARRALINDAVLRASLFRRWSPAVTVRFFLKEHDGVGIPVIAVSDQDRIARFEGGYPQWSPDSIEFSLQTDNNSVPHTQRYRWSFKTHQTTVVDNGQQIARASVIGPRGGALHVERIGGERRLREQVPAGRSYDYGISGVSIADSRAPGAWRAPDGSFALVAVRIIDGARYGLLRIGRDGRVKLIQTRGSLRNCSFSVDMSNGVCVREGMALPPQLVTISSASGSVKILRSLSPRHDRIVPLTIQAHRWTNANGFKYQIFVVLPRTFRRGGRYPAIFVTHGSDADERFGASEFQWNYPVQVLAERGYVIVLVDEPDIAQSKLLEDANAAWSSCDGRVAPADIRQLIWLNEVESLRGAIAALSNAGVIDPQRIGIAGYSYGSQVTNVAITQTRLFRAASSGDGGYLEPELYRARPCGYRAIYGGAPGDAAAYPDYLAFAPSYRARYSRTPLLQQVVEPRPAAIDLFQAFEAAKTPAELTLYPGESPASDESHVFHIPSNRLAAMTENVEWFDFWLRGIAPSDGPDGQRRKRWEALRRSAQGAHPMQASSAAPNSPPTPG